SRIRGILAVRAAALGPIGPGAAAGAFFNHDYAFLARHFTAFSSASCSGAKMTTAWVVFMVPSPQLRTARAGRREVMRAR
ncbi:hypothetical protein ACM614_07970, partial [Streptomyces sp. 12297]